MQIRTGKSLQYQNPFSPDSIMLSIYILILTALSSSTFLVQGHPEISSIAQPSDFVVQATRKWLKNTPPFQNCSSDEEISNSIVDLTSWKAPDYMVKHFPHYLAGLSYERLPIYIMECGKYDVAALMRQGHEVVDNIDKAMAQAVVRGLKSMENGGLDNTTYRVYVIADFEGYSYKHYSSPSALGLFIRLTIKFAAMAEHFIEKIYLINGNYAVDSLYNMLRPILGHLTERVEIYGPKKSKWQSVLKSEFPLDVLPPWYGGYGNFTPIVAYG